jgi:hypothetical protein
VPKAFSAGSIRTRTVSFFVFSRSRTKGDTAYSYY